MSEDIIVLRTKDADEAAFFWTQEENFELCKVDTTDHFGRTMVWFCFSSGLSKEEVNRVRNDYRNGKCLVEPKKYSYRRAELRNIIREKYNQS